MSGCTWLCRRTNGRVGGRGWGDPRWFLNLKAAGKGHIRIREQEHDVDAHLTSGAERDELWAQIGPRAPHFAGTAPGEKTTAEPA